MTIVSNTDVRMAEAFTGPEIGGDHLKAVSTDGHRLAIAEVKLAEKIKGRKQQFIVPRKGIMELSRLLERDDSTITLEFGDNHRVAPLLVGRVMDTNIQTVS